MDTGRADGGSALARGNGVRDRHPRGPGNSRQSPAFLAAMLSQNSSGPEYSPATPTVNLGGNSSGPEYSPTSPNAFLLNNPNEEYEESPVLEQGGPTIANSSVARVVIGALEIPVATSGSILSRVAARAEIPHGLALEAENGAGNAGTIGGDDAIPSEESDEDFIPSEEESEDEVSVVPSEEESEDDFFEAENDASEDRSFGFGDAVHNYADPDPLYEADFDIHDVESVFDDVIGRSMNGYFRLPDPPAGAFTSIPQTVSLNELVRKLREESLKCFNFLDLLAWPHLSTELARRQDRHSDVARSMSTILNTMQSLYSDHMGIMSSHSSTSMQLLYAQRHGDAIRIPALSAKCDKLEARELRVRKALDLNTQTYISFLPLYCETAEELREFYREIEKDIAGANHHYQAMIVLLQNAIRG